MYLDYIMNILFLGDSLIEYFNWQARFPGHSVTNAGLAGESVGGLLARAAKIKDRCPEADMVFIMSGTNNIAMGDADFIDAYRDIIAGLSSAYPSARIFLNSLLPSGADFMDSGSIMKVNALLEELAGKCGAVYLDIYRLFADENNRAERSCLLDDGVHLSARGYALWSGEVGKLIGQ